MALCMYFVVNGTVRVFYWWLMAICVCVCTVFVVSGTACTLFVVNGTVYFICG